MTSVPARVSRVTLADQVRDYIVLEIAHGRIVPGAPLRELEVAEKLGVSQTPVREAFRELVAVGLLESRVHVGTRVRDLAEKDLVDAVPVRAALEGLAGVFAASSPPDGLAAVREAFDALEEVAGTDDRLSYAHACTQFHRSVIQSARNDSLLRAWNSLGIEVMTIMSMASSPLTLHEAAESHREIVEALESGDAEVARRVLMDHVSQYLPVAGGRG